jgi:hypothetical protein
MKGVCSDSEEIGYNKVILSLEQNLGLEWKAGMLLPLGQYSVET